MPNTEAGKSAALAAGIAAAKNLMANCQKRNQQYSKLVEGMKEVSEVMPDGGGANFPIVTVELSGNNYIYKIQIPANQGGPTWRTVVYWTGPNP